MPRGSGASQRLAGVHPGGELLDAGEQLNNWVSPKLVHRL